LRHPFVPDAELSLGSSIRPMALLWLLADRGALDEARSIAERMLAAAERMPLPPEMLAYSRAPLILALYYRGQLDAAEACMLRGLELCDPTQYSHAPHVWSDHGVSMLGYLSILWVLRGRPEEAMQRSAQAIERAHAIGRAGTVAHAHCFAAVMRYFLRDWRAVEELGAIAVKVTEDNGLRFWKSQALVIHGAGMAQVGRVDEGIASLRAGYSAMQAAGGIATGTYVHCMVAEALVKVGRLDEAEQELTEACALAERTDERFAEPELYRNRGAVALLRAVPPKAASKRSASKTDRGAATGTDDAERWFETAIRVARSQGAVWWELRATVDLCRLWNSQGRERDARERLQPVYARFSEGQSTPDLREAATLLSKPRAADPERKLRK